MGGRPFIYAVELRNYRSFEHVRVFLKMFNVLVGLNGTGKSNFIDALRLVSESLSGSLEAALRDRGGVEEVRRISRGHPTHFEINLSLCLPDKRTCLYGFKIGSAANNALKVQHEECRIFPALEEGGGRQEFYVVREGEIVDASIPSTAALESDRLFLPVVSGLKAFRPVFELLARMGFYQLQPTAIGGLQAADPGEVLRRDGSNLAAVVRRLQAQDPRRMSRIHDFLAQVVPGVVSVSVDKMGSKEQIRIGQTVNDASPWKFPGISMSDGTLRALGVLVAALQSTGSARAPKVVGIEEPEVAIHPGAVPALTEALVEASTTTQIIVTTHSPELLNTKGLQVEDLLVVDKERGSTSITPADDQTREAIQKRLVDPGELLQAGQLRIDPQFAERARRATGQLPLFPHLDPAMRVQDQEPKVEPS